jgi:hypothetical protein
VLSAARICDPATGLDRNYDLAVNGDRIAAVGSGLASHARQVIERDGNLVTAGSVNMHVRVFEWMITFGLPPDDAGSIPARLLRSTRAARAYTLSDPPLSLCMVALYHSPKRTGGPANACSCRRA